MGKREVEYVSCCTAVAGTWEGCAFWLCHCFCGYEVVRRLLSEITDELNYV